LVCDLKAFDAKEGVPDQVVQKEGNTEKVTRSRFLGTLLIAGSCSTPIGATDWRGKL